MAAALPQRAAKDQSRPVNAGDRLPASRNRTRGTRLAKIVEAFYARDVSFVSITQQFNTTTSMGRLTLNVLLSFAQFEREVVGERIRDKVAASKKKGMWMGGLPPVCTENLDPDVVVMKSAEDRVGPDASGPLDGTRDRCIFSQGPVGSDVVAIAGISSQESERTTLPPTLKTRPRPEPKTKKPRRPEGTTLLPTLKTRPRPVPKTKLEPQPKARPRPKARQGLKTGRYRS
jgi:Resolvase, N terminal domain